MTDERYSSLMDMEKNLELTQDEIKEGWHFCSEFDGLLRNNNEEEFKCTCFVDWEKLYHNA